MHTTTVKRGSFATDRRTGAVVKVTEVGGRDVMVRPAYKSDGYWTAPENLTATTDPHIWGTRQTFVFLLIVAVVSVLSYAITRDLLDHGFGIWGALAYTVTSSWAQLSILISWAGLVRR